MRIQKKIWEQEHAASLLMPTLARIEASSMVVEFINFLEKNKIAMKTAIDIGCGKGRNSLFLASRGVQIAAVDYISTALQELSTRAQHFKLQQLIDPMEAALDQPWPFADNSFDIAIDCFSSIDIETLSGRENYRAELKRCLKPLGMALVAVVSINDEFERQMMDESPGSEKNSVIWPHNQKFQKNYDLQEFKEFYKDFTMVSVQEIAKPAEKLGRQYRATNIVAYLQNPSL